MYSHKKMISVLLLLLFFCQSSISKQPTVAYGDFRGMSGNAFMPMCSDAVRFMDEKSKVDPNAIAKKEFIQGMLADQFCRAYIAGTIGAYDEMTSGESGMCIPDNVESDQEIRIVDKYLHNHPEQLQKRAALLIRNSMREAFPCKK